MQYTKEQCRYIVAELDSIGERELHRRYDEMFDECFTSVCFGALEYDSSYVLKCCDKIAYNCGYNYFLDGEIGTSITDEINGEHYDLDEVTCLLEDFAEPESNEDTDEDTSEAGDKSDAFIT